MLCTGRGTSRWQVSTSQMFSQKGFSCRLLLIYSQVGKYQCDYFYEVLDREERYPFLREHQRQIRNLQRGVLVRKQGSVLVLLLLLPLVHQLMMMKL